MVVIKTDVVYAVDCMIDIVEVVALVVVVMVPIDGDVTGDFDALVAVAVIVVGSPENLS